MSFIFALQTPYDVEALTSGDTFCGDGSLVYYPRRGQFEFISLAYHFYGAIINALLQAGNDENMLQPADDLIENSLKVVGVHSKDEGMQIFNKTKMKSCSFSDGRLKFQYDGKDVEIIFSNSAGLTAVKQILFPN